MVTNLNKNWTKFRARIINKNGKFQLVQTNQETADWLSGDHFNNYSLKKHTKLSLSENDYDKLVFGIGKLTENLEAYKIAAEKERIRRITQQRIMIAEKNKRIEAEENAKRANEKTQNKTAENNQLKTELAEMELLLAKIRIEESELSKTEQKLIKESRKTLSEMNLIGTTRSIPVRGHPRRTLALRLGVLIPDNSTRLEMEFLETLQDNKFRVKFNGHSKTGVVALGLDLKTKTLYAATFYNERNDWFEAEQNITGLSEIGLKDRVDISLETLIQYHENILGKLSQTYSK